jgi:hypothetical protein
LVAAVEAFHHGQQPFVVDGDGAVDLLVAAAAPLACVSSATADRDGDARDGNANAGGRRTALVVVVVDPGELVGDAADLADAGNDELPGAEGVEVGDLTLVVGEEKRGVGGGVVAAGGGVVVGHEVVVEVVGIFDRRDHLHQ